MATLESTLPLHNMDYIFSAETQAGIDNLFDTPTVVETPEVVLEEKDVAPEYESYNPNKDPDLQGLISELFSAGKSTTVEQIKEEVDNQEVISEIVLEDAEDPFNGAFEEFGDLIQESKVEIKGLKVEETISEPKETLNPYMAGLVDNLSKFTKKNPIDTEITSDDLLEQRLQKMQIQLDRMKGMIMEGTMVSGIGQGGDGQTPGSGEVKVLKMDDVLHGNTITDGDVLVWDEVEGGFVPVPSGGLSRDAGNDQTIGEPETTRTVLLEKAAPKMIQLADTRMGRNELWPSQMLTQEDANEGFASFILELDRLKPTMYVGDNPPLDPSLGDLWFDATLLEMRMWYNDPEHPSEDLKWISVMAPGNSGVAAVSDSPPENPSVGQTWFDSHMLELRVWYVPPGTDQEGKWVSAINPGKGAVEEETEPDTYTGGAPATTTVVSYGPTEEETTTESVSDSDTSSSSTGY